MMRKEPITLIFKTRKGEEIEIEASRLTRIDDPQSNAETPHKKQNGETDICAKCPRNKSLHDSMEKSNDIDHEFVHEGELSK